MQVPKTSFNCRPLHSTAHVGTTSVNCPRGNNFIQLPTQEQFCSTAEGNNFIQLPTREQPPRGNNVIQLHTTSFNCQRGNHCIQLPTRDHLHLTAHAGKLHATTCAGIFHSTAHSIIQLPTGTTASFNCPRRNDFIQLPTWEQLHSAAHSMIQLPKHHISSHNIIQLPTPSSNCTQLHLNAHAGTISFNCTHRPSTAEGTELLRSLPEHSTLNPKSMPSPVGN